MADELTGDEIEARRKQDEVWQVCMALAIEAERIMARMALAELKRRYGDDLALMPPPVDR